MSTTAAQSVNLSDDEVRERFLGWLGANLPADWIKAIETGDAELLRSARRGLDGQDFLVRIGEAGWAQPTWPTAYGGAGLEVAQARIVEELKNEYKVPRSFNVIGLGMGAPTIMQWGSEELKKRYLPPMAQNREIWCQLFSEPGAGSDVAGLATRAVRDGDEWIVNGQKVWTTLAHIASFGLLVARTNPDAPKHTGLSYFIVDMKAPGVEVRPLKQITGDAEFNEVFFTDVRIHDSHRLGNEGDGWAVATTTLMNERVALSGSGSSGGENVGGGPVDELLAFAKGNGAWDDPHIRQRLVQAVIDGRVLRTTNYRAAAKRKAGAAGPEGSITKLFQALYNQRLQNLAVDILGATGMAWTADDSATGMRIRGFLRSRANTIEGGTTEVMKNILGDRVLGLPREPDASKGVPWKDVPRSQ
ncbi:MAG TPA: acyl-CoA dehydrogenase family protein [Acidimicrobiales bacterium]|nr:acyl-CoA dehydrogenase family protein [Acidimicrobiales bacterium]